MRSCQPPINELRIVPNGHDFCLWAVKAKKRNHANPIATQETNLKEKDIWLCFGDTEGLKRKAKTEISFQGMAGEGRTVSRQEEIITEER